MSPVPPLAGEAPLRLFLATVGAMRVLSIVLGLGAPEMLTSNVYDLASDDANALLGRLFAAWTSLSSFLAFSLALRPRDLGVCRATMASFAIAIVYFGFETFLFSTMSVAALMRPIAVAVPAFVWLGVWHQQVSRGAVLDANKRNA